MKFTKTEEEKEWDERLKPRRKLIQYRGKFKWLWGEKYGYWFYASHGSRLPKKRGFSRYLKRRQYHQVPEFFTATFKQSDPQPYTSIRSEYGYAILHNRIT